MAWTAFGGSCLSLDISRQGNLEKVINVPDKTSLADDLVMTRRQKTFVAKSQCET